MAKKRVESKEYGGKLYYHNSNWATRKEAVQKAKQLEKENIPSLVQKVIVLGRIIWQVWAHDRDRENKIKIIKAKSK